MRHFANTISVFRIALSFLLFFLEPLAAFFLSVYAIAGLSDMVDGFVARKTHSTSKIGEKLDSIGDFVLVAALLYTLLPILDFTWTLGFLIGFVGLVRVLSLLLVFMKYHTFAVLHTYANKATGFMLFIFPFFFAYFESLWSLYAIAVFALISALEELVIHLKTESLDVNQVSILGMFTK